MTPGSSGPALSEPTGRILRCASSHNCPFLPRHRSVARHLSSVESIVVSLSAADSASNCVSWSYVGEKPQKSSATLRTAKCASYRHTLYVGFIGPAHITSEGKLWGSEGAVPF